MALMQVRNFFHQTGLQYSPLKCEIMLNNMILLIFSQILVRQDNLTNLLCIIDFTSRGLKYEGISKGLKYPIFQGTRSPCATIFNSLKILPCVDMYNKSNWQIFHEGVESTSRDMNFYVFSGTRENGCNRRF